MRLERTCVGNVLLYRGFKMQTSSVRVLRKVFSMWSVVVSRNIGRLVLLRELRRCHLGRQIPAHLPFVFLGL